VAVPVPVEGAVQSTVHDVLVHVEWVAEAPPVIT